MGKENLIFIGESALGISIVGLIILLILFALISAPGEERQNKMDVKKLQRKEKQLREKEEKLKHIEKRFRS